MGATYSAIYSFGDSLSDAGNLSIATAATGIEPISPPYYKQAYGSISGNMFSNGPTWAQNLSVALGLGTLKPSLAGGTDFAFGGAETGTTPQNANDLALQAISLPFQLTTFKTAEPNVSSTALFTVSIGANDLLAVLADTTLTPTQQAIDLQAAVTNEVSFVRSLVAAGAKNVLVLNVPDLGKIPEVTTGAVIGADTPSPGLVTEATYLSAAYNASLANQLGVIGGATIQVVDLATLIDNAIATPATYGLTNVTTPVWSGDYTSASSGTLTTSDLATQNQSLFFDHLHPTETGQTVMMQAAQQILNGIAPLTVSDTTTSQPVLAAGLPYIGPVAGLQQQYLNTGSDNLNVTATTPNWFILAGSGQDAVSVASGANVLDGGAGSNFLTGGTGTDTFFLDDRAPAAVTWSTINNLNAADNVTLWGITQADFSLNWLNSAGAAGYTGLTLTAVAAGKPEAILTLAGFSQADLGNGRLTVAYGTDAASGSAYMNIHAAG
ncbi:MAG TPA: hypothetical protein DDZ81_14245 [Acetobacteraceae bacterium]|jgi:phospholipase/lecithinase/hemolysin|nr:hypothetical protein [Acetobacteraceae bacterium]